jgi:succinate-acetate transporter protein
MQNPVIPIREETQTGTEIPARIFLQPIAAPSILGLYGFTLSTWIIAVNMAGWYASPELVPFAAFFGGLAQFMAGMWAFRSRDAMASALHGLWGTFWMAYGLVGILVASGAINIRTVPPPGFGWWFVVLAGTTWVLMAAAFQFNRALTLFLGILATAATLTFLAEFAGSRTWGMIAGYAFMLSAILAWGIASIMVLQASGRTVFPVRTQRTEPVQRVSVGIGEPGVVRGQS